MPEDLLLHLVGIILIGVTAQWLAWRIRLPSILLLLTFGLIAGPILGWLKPDQLFGGLIAPVVSLSVGLILFEGGLTLKMSELRKVGAIVGSLVTIGALVTWTITALAGYFVLALSPAYAALLAAILVVTGPTVIGPLLRYMRPTGIVGPVLKWEGIVIDPIGAMLAVLVFECISIGEAREATLHVGYALLTTVFAGGGLGLAAAALLTLALHRHWIPDYLQNPVSLMLVVIVFALSNQLQHESGLLATTVMGFALANQRWVQVEHIVEFKENVRVLLISMLFIVLAARIDGADLKQIAPAGLAFAAILVFVARPLTVFVSTIRSNLATRDRLFLAWMAPRGIVAAAVASVFALRLESQGVPGANLLVPVTFLTIITTVAVYGLTSPILARRLGLAQSNPQGLLIVGAQSWARQLALLLQREGFHTLLVDSNRTHTHEARMAGLNAYTGSILAERTIETLDLGGIGRMLALTPNDWVNVLAVQRFERILGRKNCYQLPPPNDKANREHHYLHGRWLFRDDASYETLSGISSGRYALKATRLSESFDLDAFRSEHGSDSILLFVCTTTRKLVPVVAGAKLEIRDGETVLALVPAADPS